MTEYNISIKIFGKKFTKKEYVDGFVAGLTLQIMQEGGTVSDEGYSENTRNIKVVLQ